jgi:hemerythrin HHE cation binding domain-containing protein
VCEYCGCQALATISELTREHELVADLTSLARAALAKADVPLMTDLARQIAAILAPHTAVEEDGLFPALAADFPATSPHCKPNTSTSKRCWARP